MINIFELGIFIFFGIYILIYSISYGLYEIKEKNNKAGGIFVISLSIISTIIGIFSLFIT